ncbi:MAG: MmcQ/YjbR family DNA-binding protein [Saprospiraceae bacterium]|nr:MmcQ/YjbR family DNA-binding protein [Bacteroidia bacterium]NNL93507.1 MmcQ/YjbR family DNA-binding protein [Saprospiraceae bacterium]
MNIETFREYCLMKKGCEETFPFDEVTLVFKVMGKMFALVPLDEEIAKCNLKADPEWSIELREAHDQIIPGFHMNKKHWNTVRLEEGLSDKLITEMIDHSYDLVVSKLTKKLKAELEKL